MAERKTDVEQIKGILEEFLEEDIIKAIEEMGIKIPRVKPENTIDLFLETVGEIIPWHKHVVGFPKKFYWAKNEEVGEIRGLTVKYTENNRVKSIIGYTDNNDPVEADFCSVRRSVGVASFFYKNKKEANLSMMYSQNSLQTIFTYLPDESMNFSFIITDPSKGILYTPQKEFEVEIKLLDKVIKGNIAVDMEYPPILKDLSKVIEDIKGPKVAKVAAFDEVFLEPIAIEAWKDMPSIIEVKGWREGLCAVATGLGDVLTMPMPAVGTIIVGFVNGLLL